MVEAVKRRLWSWDWDATDRSKISSDQKRFFIAFFANTPFNVLFCRRNVFQVCRVGGTYFSFIVLTERISVLSWWWNIFQFCRVEGTYLIFVLLMERISVLSCWWNVFSGTFTCLAAVFRMKRNPGFLFFSTYIPSVLIVIMSWISFWIPPESTPARY